MQRTKNIISSPHIRGSFSVAGMMQIVLLALLPTTLYGIYNFGYRAFLHLLICVVTCVLSELIYEVFTNKKLTIGDFSAVVTGLLLGLSLPVSAPLWIGALGGIFAIVLIKQIFGGIGQNMVNPALAARGFLMFVFPDMMTNYVCDAYTSATPLALVQEQKSVDVFRLMVGNVNGCIGETSLIALLIGAIVLLMAGVVTLRIPFAAWIAFAIMIVAFGGRGYDETFLLSHLTGGGFMLGIWFMATDCTTSPITKNGQRIYGASIGVVAALFRLFSVSGAGMTYAILIGNLLVPLIEKYTVPRAFGKPKFELRLKK